MQALQQVGEFILEAKLGEGGMGEVYRARQVALDRWVAIKFLSRTAARDSQFAQRFYREARAAAKLVHPSIVQIYTTGDHDGVPYYAMEYVEGISLADLLQKGPLSLEETVELVRSVARGLELAASHGIVHRDIKPGNVMITTSGQAKVMDFGLAKATRQSASELTHDGQILGTPAYFSPEQAMGRKVDTRSDLYSLGCVLYECLAGRPPFEAEEVATLVFRHVYSAVEPPRKHSPWVPESLEKTCLKLLAKSPEERFQTPGELLEALEEVACKPGLAESALARRVAQYAQAAAAAPAAEESQEEAVAAPQHRAAPGPQAPAAEHDEGWPAAVAEPQGGSPAALAGAAGMAGVRASPVPTPRLAELAGAESAPGLAPLGPPSTEIAAPLPRARTKPKIPASSFRKLRDGRWGYDASKGHCAYAEGLAAEALPGADAMVGPQGDCLICANWTQRHGCALAKTQELWASGEGEGAQLLEEVCSVWVLARRFEKAIAAMEEYIQGHGAEPAAYRALARVYDHPNYPGKDRTRAIVLYNRFLELAQSGGRFSALELKLARERMEALKSRRVETPKTTGVDDVPTLQIFRCFYRRNSEVFFALGALSRECLRLAKVGALDPESGLRPSDLNLAPAPKSLFKRRGRRTDTKDRQLARNELERLSRTPVKHWDRDAELSVTLVLANVDKVTWAEDPDTKCQTICLEAQAKRHQLVFPGTPGDETIRCALILKRLTGK